MNPCTPNEKLVRRIYDAIEAHDIDEVMALSDDDVVLSSSIISVVRGKKEWADGIRVWLRAFPDVRFEINHSLAANDTVVTEYIMSGTHSGGPLPMPDGEIPATGAPFAVQVCDVHRFRNGLLVENRVYSDALVLLRQLGVLPG